MELTFAGRKKSPNCKNQDPQKLVKSTNQGRNPSSGPPPVYQDLSTRHDWIVKKAIVDLPIRLKGNLKRISGKLLSPLGAENNDVGAASQTLLTGVRLRLRRRLNILQYLNVSLPNLAKSKFRPNFVL